MTLITPSKVAATLEAVTREQMMRCTRCTEDNGEVWYRVTSESKANTYYEVKFSRDFSFTCTCESGQHAFSNVRHPSGVCKHVRWSLAASLEYKRLLKVDPASIEVVNFEPGVRLDHLDCNDGYTALYFNHLRQYGCTCPLDNLHQSSKRPVCVHMQAAKRYRDMLHEEYRAYEREINR